MISESTRSRNPAGHAGLLENVLALVSALAGFFESRFVLVAQESKVAVVQVLILASCLILAMLLCALGYIFLITGAAAGVHFFVALVLLLVARSRITKPLFRATMAELRKDREWLRNLDATNQST